MKIFLNVIKLNKLQSKLKLSEIEMSKKLSINRTQLWRAKAGEPVGEKFIAGFKSAFPNLSIDEFFLTKVLLKSDTTKK